MLFSAIKGANRLISKGMSNIYLKVTIEKNWHSQKCNFLSFLIFKKSSSFVAKNFLLQLKNHCSGSKTVCGFSVILVLKVKESMNFVEQKSLIKMKRNRKWKIPYKILDRQTLYFSSNKNRELKGKL